MADEAFEDPSGRLVVDINIYVESSGVFFELNLSLASLAPRNRIIFVSM